MATAKAIVSFEAIRKHKVFEDIAEQIQRHIGAQLQPGDMLPTERDLARLFGVSRSSVREAIRSLEVAGLVESRRGLGTIVREVTAESVIHPLASLLKTEHRVSDVLEFRIILEPPLARRAALHATSQQISALEEILRRQLLPPACDTAIEEDSEFHYSLALAANNGVVLKLLDLLRDILLRGNQQALMHEHSKHSLSAHRRILAAITKRNPDAAEAAMRRHLHELRNIAQRRGADPEREHRGTVQPAQAALALANRRRFF